MENKLKKLLQTIDFEQITYKQGQDFLKLTLDIVEKAKKDIDDKLLENDEINQNNIQEFNKKYEDIKNIVNEFNKKSTLISSESYKKDIAKYVKVPIIDKIIEKTETIIEKPIITNEIREVSKTDEPNVIVNKINEAQNKIRVDKIDGLNEMELRIKSDIAMPITTSFINGKRAKNIDILGSSVVVSGDTAKIRLNTPIVVSYTDRASSVIDVTVIDLYKLTAVANDTTFSTTGTGNDGQKLMIRFKDAGVAKNLTWDSIFRVIGVTLPTITVAGKTHYVGCVYNSTDSKWDVLAVGQEA